MSEIKVRWSANRQFIGWDEAGHGVVMDARPEYKGEGTGPRPVDLVLYGLAGCTGMDVISVLQKKRQDVVGLQVNVRGHQREEDYPHYYEDIHVEYVITGHSVTEAAVARAIQLSEEKYCSVKGMFGPQVRVTTSFLVVEAEGPHE